MDVGKHFKFRCAADVVTITAGAVADDLVAITLADLTRLEGLDHAGGLCHVADPFVAFDAHGNSTPRVAGL